MESLFLGWNLLLVMSTDLPDGALLTLSLVLGLVGGVIGTLATYFVVKSSYARQVTPGLEYARRVEAKLHEKEVQDMAMRRRGESDRDLTARELRNMIGLLNEKVGRVMEQSGLDAGDEEGDWGGFDASQSSAPSTTPRLEAGKGLKSPKRGWAKDLLSAEADLRATTDGKGHSKVQPLSLVVFTDFGGRQEDTGDEVALFMLRGLETLEFVRTVRQPERNTPRYAAQYPPPASSHAQCPAVTSHARRCLRALPCAQHAIILSGAGPVGRTNRAHAVIVSLGFEHGVVFGVGAECEGYTPPAKGSNGSNGSDGSNGSPNLAPPRPELAVLDAARAFYRVLDDPHVADYTLIVNLLCAPTDFAAMLRERGEGIARKLKCVCMLGAVSATTAGFDALTNAKAYSGTESYLRPDPTHPQHVADPEASEYVFQRLQELGVPLIVVGRHAVYAAAVPAALYDELARTNSPFAKELKASQRRAIDELWHRVQAPLGSAERAGMPERCTADWFGQVFCGGSPPPLGATPWEYIASFNMYDCVAVCASVPQLRYRLFADEPEHEYDAGVAIHVLFGQSEALAGVRRPKELMRLIHSASLAGVSSLPDPYPMIVFTDPGQDLDDELAMIMLRSLVAQRFVRPIGLVANLHPSDARARLLKGQMRVLGLPDVPVAVGTDGGRTDHVDTFSSTAPYIASETEVESDANAMLRRVLKAEADATVLCVCISSLTDAWGFLQAEEALFTAKVHSVTIMGGIELSDDNLVELGDENALKKMAKAADGGATEGAHSRAGLRRRLSSDSLTGKGGSTDKSKRLLKPDTANNNTFDFPAALQFYQRVQQLGIRLNVLTRFAAYGCPMPRKVYDVMRATKNPIAERLFLAQRTSIEGLWKRCNAAGEARLGLPPRCDKEWFCKTFLKGSGNDRSGNDSVWDLVQTLNMYDVLALVYAVPHLAWRFFEPSLLGGSATFGGEAARLVGISPKQTGVKDREVLRQFIIDGLLEGLRCGPELEVTER